MKAVKILKKIYKNNPDIRSQMNNIDINFTIHNLNEINEAIKELEELENRSCSNCKYNKEQDNFMIFCDRVMCEDGSKMMWHSFTKHFCCNRWENKHKTTNF